MRRPVRACPVTWRFKGPAHGYALKSTEGTSVLLTIGEQQARVTVEACLSGEAEPGGCATLTLTADILDAAQDLAAYQEVALSDFTEPRFFLPGPGERPVPVCVLRCGLPGEHGHRGVLSGQGGP